MSETTYFPPNFTPFRPAGLQLSGGMYGLSAAIEARHEKASAPGDAEIRELVTSYDKALARHTELRRAGVRDERLTAAERQASDAREKLVEAERLRAIHGRRDTQTPPLTKERRRQILASSDFGQRMLRQEAEEKKKK